jgi:hypothetical protein
VLDPKPHLIRFVEVVDHKKSDLVLEDNQLSFARIEQDAGAVPITHLAAWSTHVSDEEEGLPDLLVVHKDGLVRLMSGELSSERWRVYVGTKSSTGSDAMVKLLGVFDSNLVRTSFLSQAADTVSEDDLVLAYAIQSTTEISIRFDVIRQAVGSASVQNITTVVIPAPQIRPEDDLTKMQFNLDIVSGIIHSAFLNRIASYDLRKANSSRPISYLRASSDKSQSLALISPNLLITSSGTELSLYDTRYETQQAYLTNVTETLTSSKKRKRDAPPIPLQLRIELYLPNISLAIASTEGLLVGIPITDAPTKTVAPAIGIFDAIGRGKLSERRHTRNLTISGQLPVSLLKISEGARRGNAKKLRELKPELEKAISNSDVGKLEELVAGHLKLEVQQEQHKSNGSKTNGHHKAATNHINPWICPKTGWPRPSDDLYSYLISKLFSVDSSKLTIALPTKQLLKYFIDSGSLDVHGIYRSKDISSPNGSLSEALVQLDPLLLRILVDSACFLPLEELLFILQLTLKNTLLHDLLFQKAVTSLYNLHPQSHIISALRSRRNAFDLDLLLNQLNLTLQSTASEDPTLTLATITLMTSLIDAAGLISTLNTQNINAEVVTPLLRETDNATQLQGMLEGLLRYSQVAQSRNLLQSKEVAKIGSALPLELVVEGKGDLSGRSRREVQLLKDMSVPVYTRERIEI